MLNDEDEVKEPTERIRCSDEWNRQPGTVGTSAVSPGTHSHPDNTQTTTPPGGF